MVRARKKKKMKKKVSIRKGKEKELHSKSTPQRNITRIVLAVRKRQRISS